ncbi:MAG: ATP-binding protein [Saprospiraceae bacterium]
MIDSSKNALDYIEKAVNPREATSPILDFQEMVELNVAGLFTLENDIVTYANSAFCAILEKKTEAVVGSSILERMPLKDQAKLKDILHKMADGIITTASDNFKVKVHRRKIKYFSLHLKLAEKLPNNKVKIIGASRDSTERVLASIELEKAKGKFEALYKNMMAGIVIYDYVGEKVIDCNESAYKMLGFETKEEFVKLTRYDIFPKTSHYFPGVDIHDEIRKHGRMIVNHQSVSTLGIFNGKNNKEVLAKINVIPTFYKKGEGFAIFHDITKEVQRKIELQSSEKKYRNIFENSHEAVTFLDVKTGKMIDCNNNALRLYGVASKRDLINLPKENFHQNFITKKLETENYIRSKITEALDQGKAYVSFEAKKLNGVPFIYDGVFVSDFSDPKNPKILSFSRDAKDVLNAEKEKNKLIAALVAAKEEINERNNELKKYIESNLQLENFAYFASHDLRTPLRSIISFTQLLKRSSQNKLTASEIEYMDFIIDAGRNMQNLVDDLLSFSRINSADINLERIDLSLLIKKITDELSADIEEKNAAIITDKIPSHINADKTKFNQLLQNLISNAIKFTEKNKQPKVEISAKELENNWHFSVKDNGIGISEEYKEKVFLLFKRLHNSTEYEGTGIGLALCKKIVEQHEGKIWFESEEGKGTHFHFTIKKN